MGSLVRKWLSSIYFYFRTGLKESEVRKICRDLSNLFLTYQKPGIVDSLDVEIVTATPMMLLTFGDARYGKYWVSRSTLIVYFHEEKFSLWDKRAEVVLHLFKHFKENGIQIPRNNDGVTYIRMPDEEKFNGSNA